MEKKFRVGEIVWAKVRGFPWWPGKVAKLEDTNIPNQETRVLVNFVGDSSHAEVKISNIEKYEAKYSEYSKSKKKNLLNAIHIANKLLKGEGAEDNHANILTRRRNFEKCVTSNEDDRYDIDTSLNKKRIKLLKKKRSRKISHDENTTRQGNNGAGNPHSTSDAESEEDSNPAEELKNKIKQLVFSKIEMPSSTSCKSVNLSLNVIEDLIKRIDPHDLYDSSKELFPYLSCLFRHKNQDLSTKAFNLCKNIEKIITDNLFLSYDSIHKIKIESDENIKSKEFGKSLIAQLTSQLEKNKTDSFTIQKKQKIVKCLIEDSNSISEISLDSYRTDCEDSKSHSKNKIPIVALDRKNIHTILSDYFEYRSYDVKDFFINLTKGKYFQFLNEDKISKPVRYHYMRRRVCYKLYKVFEKILIKEEINSQMIKDLSIFLEFRARENDPLMGDKYKDYISSIFNKIKEELSVANYSTIVEEY